MCVAKCKNITKLGSFIKGVQNIDVRWQKEKILNETGEDIQKVEGEDTWEYT